MKENKLIPKRRFKEFKNDEAWEQRKIKDIFKVTRGHVLAVTKTAREKTASTPYPVYSSQTTDQGLMGYYNDYLYSGAITWTTDGANAGTVNYREGKFYCTNVCGVLISEEGYANKMISEALNKVAWKHVSKVGNPKLMNNVMSEIVISIPRNMKEQSAISNFFNSLDNLITLHQRKLKKLKETKLAYLSEMFPKEGEKYPKRRFDGFTEAWEQRKVKDVCEISTGKSNTQDRIEDGIYPFYVRSPIIERSNRYLYDEEAILTVGDGVGTGKVYHYVNGKYDLHQRVYRMFDFKNGVLAKYFYHHFSNHFYDRVMAMTAKTSVDSVRYEMIAGMDIEIPSEKEQAKIIDYLDTLDNLITLHKRKLKKLENLKKAYLNEMFV